MNFINNLIKRIQHKIMVFSLYRPKVHNIKIDKLGNSLGIWHIPSGYLSYSSTIISIGGGEDISFELDLYNLTKSKIHIFDPTPRSKKYILEKINSLGGIKFHEYGIADTNRKAKFYFPKDPKHVSCSIVNIQKTDSFIEVDFKTLDFIKKDLNIDKIDLLKLDIEGAEYQVIDYLLKYNHKVKVLCVEFDEVFNQLDSNFKSRIKEYVIKLMEFGYVPVYVTLYQNYTFVYKDYLNN